MATDSVRLTLPDMTERFKFLGDKLGPTVFAAMLISAQKMLADVVSKRMSNPRRGSTDRNLGVDFGTARRSMIDKAGITEDKVFALIGSPVGYVRTHEEGFHGPVQVRGHVRQLVALTMNAKGKVTKKSAAAFKSAVRNKQATTAHVRAYSRKVDIIAKHFIRDTVTEAVPPTEERIMRALVIAAKTGRVPSPTQLGA